MNRPKVLDQLIDKATAVMDKNTKPYLTTEEACEILGCTPESLLNAAACNNLPFGFVHKKGEGYRRNLVIEKLALWNWLTKGNAL